MFPGLTQSFRQTKHEDDIFFNNNSDDDMNLNNKDSKINIMQQLMDDKDNIGYSLDLNDQSIEKIFHDCKVE